VIQPRAEVAGHYGLRHAVPHAVAHPSTLVALYAYAHAPAEIPTLAGTGPPRLGLVGVSSLHSHWSAPEAAPHQGYHGQVGIAVNVLCLGDIGREDELRHCAAARELRLAVHVDDGVAQAYSVSTGLVLNLRCPEQR
jgi:hypothetical protein